MIDSDLKELGLDELDNKLKDARGELFNLRFQHATGQLDNPIKLRLARRRIARILTLQHMKKEEEGKEKV